MKFLRISILKNICERLLLHFQYNSHHYFLYHHFHHSQKMHLYLLRILLTIAVDCNMIPSLFKLNFAFFLLAYIFLWSFSRIHNLLSTNRPILEVFFKLVFISVIISTSLFTLNCLYLFTLTYLCLYALYTII